MHSRDEVPIGIGIGINGLCKLEFALDCKYQDSRGNLG
jgi:hypothetical protein